LTAHASPLGTPALQLRTFHGHSPDGAGKLLHNKAGAFPPPKGIGSEQTCLTSPPESPSPSPSARTVNVLAILVMASGYRQLGVGQLGSVLCPVDNLKPTTWPGLNPLNGNCFQLESQRK